MLLALLTARVFAAEPAPAPQPPENGVCDWCVAPSETPVLVLNGTPHYAQEFAVPEVDAVLDTIPGVTGAWFVGVPRRDVTVMLDGVVVDHRGFLSP